MKNLTDVLNNLTDVTAARVLVRIRFLKYTITFAQVEPCRAHTPCATQLYHRQLNACSFSTSDTSLLIAFHHQECHILETGHRTSSVLTFSLGASLIQKIM